MRFKTIVLTILIILIIIPIFQNTKEIKLYLFFWEFNIASQFIFSAILFLGFVFGYIVAKVDSKKRNRIIPKPTKD